MRPQRSLVATFAAAVLTASGFAPGGAPQAQEAGQPAGFILGQVVDAESGTGIPGVVVTVAATAAASTTPAQPPAELIEIGSSLAALAGGRQVLTAADGRFLFRDLSGGRYRLTATAPAYVPGRYGQSRPTGPGLEVDLRQGETRGGVTIRMWRFASVSGTVLDDASEPVAGLPVRAFQRVIAGGQPRFTTSVLATTDDRGVYRIAGLEPGTYAVGVLVNQTTTPVSAVDAYVALSESGKVNTTEMYRTLTMSAGELPSNANGRRIGDHILRESATMPRPAQTTSRLMTYPTVFHGGGSAPSQSTLIALGSGEERLGVDLALRLVPTVRVSGVVIGPDGPAAYVAMNLVTPSGLDLTSEGAAESASTITDGQGRFTFLAVPSGRCTLKIRLYARATGQARGGPPPPPPPSDATFWALHPITVGDTNLDDINVVLRPGLKVTGRVQFTGTRQAPNADQMARVAITLQAAEGRTSAPIAVPGRMMPEGTFRTSGYPAGRYIAAATAPPGWHLASIVSNGRDVSVEPIELIDRDIDDLVVTFVDQTTQVSGTVSSAGVDHQIEAIGWPADSTAWREIGVPARRWRHARVGANGTFSFSGLPPGEYYVAAVDVLTVDDLRDPRILETLQSAAARTTLAPGAAVSLRLQPIKLASTGGGR